MTTRDCNACPLYQASAAFARATIAPPLREHSTKHGRLIAAECSRLGLSLAAVSMSCGYSSDYLARVCRGSLPLVRSAAVRIGDKLGVSLGGFVVATERKPRKAKDAPETAAAPSLPGVSGEEAE
jgi:lambda repressor-like predicted transcriptional regulator